MQCFKREILLGERSRAELTDAPSCNGRGKGVGGKCGGKGVGGKVWEEGRCGRER
jgi:hypothetical protein